MTLHQHPHTCTGAERATGHTADCYGCQATHGHHVATRGEIANALVIAEGRAAAAQAAGVGPDEFRARVLADELRDMLATCPPYVRPVALTDRRDGLPVVVIPDEDRPTVAAATARHARGQADAAHAAALADAYDARERLDAAHAAGDVEQVRAAVLVLVAAVDVLHRAERGAADAWTAEQAATIG